MAVKIQVEVLRVVTPYSVA